MKSCRVRRQLPFVLASRFMEDVVLPIDAENAIFEDTLPA